MIKKNRKLMLDIYNYSNKKICPIYDNNVDVIGQAYNIYVNTERNGWKELSFNIPYEIIQNGTLEDNYRINYIKPGFLIKLIDDEGEDWFVINKPVVNHNGNKKTMSVTAGHISQDLKIKNLGLEFSDEYGGNIGTAEELLTTVLQGTGWEPGEVYEFLEDRTGDIKRRTLKCSAKTGAFKMVSTICDLFEAKPVYHGDTKKVDILPMNPFTLDNYGKPDVSSASNIIELAYSKNVKNVTRTQDFSNVVTKMYVYGSYGDVITGYCGIDELNHTEYVFTLPSLTKGNRYYFKVLDDSGVEISRYFECNYDIPSGSKMYYSFLDPSSLSYVWIESSEENTFEDISTYWKDVDEETIEYMKRSYSVSNGHAFFVKEGKKGILLDSYEKAEIKNLFSFIFDFDYFKDVDLFDDYCLQKLSFYQRYAHILYQLIQDKSLAYSYLSNELNNIIGINNYSLLNVKNVSGDNYLTLTLNTDYKEDGSIYRTDFDAKEKEKFVYVTTDELKPNGDPVNPGASLLLAIKDGEPIQWKKAYLKAKNKDKNPDVLTFHIQNDFFFDDNVKYYLFASNTINGYLGAYEASFEAINESLKTATTIATQEHQVVYTDSETLPPPINFITNSELLPDEDIDVPSWYSYDPFLWLWNYHYDDRESVLYFCYYGRNGDTDWHRVWFAKSFSDISKSEDVKNGDYFFDEYNKTLNVLEESGLVYLNSAQDLKITAMFDTVREMCIKKDNLIKGTSQYLTYLVNDGEKINPNSAIELPNLSYAIFTNKNTEFTNGTVSYNSDKKIVEFNNSSDDVVLEYIDFKKGYVNDIGELTESSEKTSCITDYLKVTSGDIYSIKGFSEAFPLTIHKYIKSENGYDYIGFDSKISGYEGTYNVQSLVTDIVIQVNADLNALSEYIDSFKFYKGLIYTTECKVVKKDSVRYFKDNYINSLYGNLFNFGYVDPKDGTYTSPVTKNEIQTDQELEEDLVLTEEQILAEKYLLSEFISLDQSTTYVLEGLQDYNKTIHFYDKNNRWLYSSYFGYGGNAQFDVTSKVYYIKINLDGYQIDSDNEEAKRKINSISSELNLYSIYADNSFLYDDVSYFILDDVTPNGNTKGIIYYLDNFSKLSDTLYLTCRKEISEAQDKLSELDSSMNLDFGSMYREGYLQKSDYVDGDEDKLYDDGIKSLKEVAYPNITYNIGYVDLAGLPDYFSNSINGFAYDMIWPEVNITSALHLVDQEIGVNCWAYVDKVQRCYDVPKNTKITINTKLSTISQHSFTDVMTNIANVASSIKGKENVIDRSSYINEDGTFDANRITGKLDLNNVEIVGGSSGFKTTDDGSMLFESADGSSAMKITGTGFMIANGKTVDGEWNWRTFGDGNGFSADEISAGTIKSALIRAGSITVDKISSDFASGLDLSSNQYVVAASKQSESLDNSSVYIGQEGITVKTGGSFNVESGSTIIFKSQNFNLNEEGDMSISGNFNPSTFTLSSSGLNVGDGEILINDASIFNANYTYEGELYTGAVIKIDGVDKILPLKTLVEQLGINATIN